MTRPVDLIKECVRWRFPGDHPRTQALHARLTEACSDFIARGIADAKFIDELTGGDDQKFWACISEALVARALQDKVFGVRTIGKGPDFLIMLDERKIWIEVICPEPTAVPDSWLEPQPGKTIDFPHVQLLLRWTAAIKEKAEKLLGPVGKQEAGWFASGVVRPDDAYVIAVNGCRLRSGPFSSLCGISQQPFAAEAVFPIGPYQVSINRETLEVLQRGHLYRPEIAKGNGAAVPAVAFLEPRFRPISAIWAVDFNGCSAYGNHEPSVVIHNPNANNPVPLGFLPADEEYTASQRGNDFVVDKVRTRGGNSQAL